MLRAALTTYQITKVTSGAGADQAIRPLTGVAANLKNGAP